MNYISKTLAFMLTIAVVLGIAPPTSTASAARPWQAAYAERVRYYAQQVPPGGVADFLLHDIDNDGVPEIIIMIMESPFPADVAHFVVYTFRNGELVELQIDARIKVFFNGRFAGGGTIFYTLNDAASSLMYRTSSGAALYFTRLSVVGDRLTISSHGIEADGGWIGAVPSWTIDNRRVTQAEFNRFFAGEIIPFQNEDLGLYWPLNEDGIQNGIFSFPVPIQVLINGDVIEFDTLPINRDGRIMLPLRTVFETMGAEVQWDAVTQTAIATRGDTTVVLTVGSVSPTINGTVVPIDQPGIIVAGRTLAPLRFVAEAFGGTVDWDNATRTVTITTTAS